MKLVWFISSWLITAGLSAQKQAMDSSSLLVNVKNASLSGTLYSNKQPGSTPVVLIIAGSGPTDRDGNSIVLPGKNNSLLQLADSLAVHGIASLRYDKRGVGKSKLQSGITEDSILFDDMVADAAALYDWLKTKGYTKIFILGHSEGSLVGMKLAQQVNPAGFISIAGSGRKAAAILKEQLAAQLTGPLKEETFLKLDSLENGYRLKKVNPMLYSLFRPSVQPYMISWLRHDPAAIIATLQCPVFILQGNNDIQVSETDANTLKAANQKARLVVIENMNHVLKEVKPADKLENMNSYSKPELPVMKQLTDEIIKFTRSN